MSEQAVANDHIRHIGEARMAIPALAHPDVEAIREMFPRRNVLAIERDTSPEVAVTLRLATILGIQEKWVDGREAERRTRVRPEVMLGFQQWDYFHRNWDGYAELRRGLTAASTIKFPGIVIVLTTGRFIPAIHFDSPKRLYLDSVCYHYHPMDRIAIAE